MSIIFRVLGEMKMKCLKDTKVLLGRIFTTSKNRMPNRIYQLNGRICSSTVDTKSTIPRQVNRCTSEQRKENNCFPWFSSTPRWSIDPIVTGKLLVSEIISKPIRNQWGSLIKENLNWFDSSFIRSRKWNSPLFPISPNFSLEWSKSKIEGREVRPLFQIKKENTGGRKLYR